MIETDEYLDEGLEDENTVDPDVDSITKELMRLENVSQEQKTRALWCLVCKLSALVHGGFEQKDETPRADAQLDKLVKWMVGWQNGKKNDAFKKSVKKQPAKIWSEMCRYRCVPAFLMLLDKPQQPTDESF